jgi:CheY-like chemotaxis protein
MKQQREKKKKVLIVDNSERVLWVYQEVLENAGCETKATWSGHEALALLRSQEFDVVLVGDYLPDLHSADFLQRVSHLPIRPWLVVMQDTKPNCSDIQLYEALGASAVTFKYDFCAVRKAVTSCCSSEPLAKLAAR